MLVTYSAFFLFKKMLWNLATDGDFVERDAFFSTFLVRLSLASLKMVLNGLSLLLVFFLIRPKAF
jgi:hypothetical protein